VGSRLLKTFRGGGPISEQFGKHFGEKSGTKVSSRMKEVKISTEEIGSKEKGAKSLGKSSKLL